MAMAIVHVALSLEAPEYGTLAGRCCLRLACEKALAAAPAPRGYNSAGRTYYYRKRHQTV